MALRIGRVDPCQNVSMPHWSGQGNFWSIASTIGRIDAVPNFGGQHCVIVFLLLMLANRALVTGPDGNLRFAEYNALKQCPDPVRSSPGLSNCDAC